MNTIRTFNERYAALEDTTIPFTQYEIEFNTLGKLLCAPEPIQRDIFEHITPQMFTDKTYRKIFEIIQDYVKNNGFKELSIFALDIYYFGEDNKVIDIEIAKTLLELASGIPCYSDYSNWVIWLQVSWKKRAFNQNKNEKAIFQIIEEFKKIQFVDEDKKLANTLSGMLDNYGKKNIIKSYYKPIDELIGGFHSGELIILGGATAMGKTAVALNFIFKMLKNGKKCLLIEYEMTKEELLQRLIANELSINSEKFRTETLTDDEMEKVIDYQVSQAFKEINKNLTIPKNAPKSINQLETYVQKSEANIIFIDHMGLIKSDIKGTRYEQITDLSRRLKLLAMDINKPIVTLCQLSRSVKENANSRPTLSNLRDSGSIEQDANTILFVYRPAYYNVNEDRTKLEIICAKSRSTGGAGKIARLKFYGEYQRITTQNPYV